jgi:hypothetical protein
MTKTCYCYTCRKWFDPLGILRHRAMHRDKRENCTIKFTYGDVYEYRYGETDKEDKSK